MSVDCESYGGSLNEMKRGHLLRVKARKSLDDYDTPRPIKYITP